MGYFGPFYIQPVSAHTIALAKIKRILVTHKSKYQNIEIIDLEEYGRTLVLDSYIQSTEIDEYIYHESLVHPVMITHPNPQKILIIGGGEGATLREVLKHSTVKEAVMVDIDEDVIKLSKKYLQKHHMGAFDDPKAKIVIADGKKYIEESSELFDIIILDLTDPYSSEVAKELYSVSFYKKVINRLTNDGLMVTQAGNSFYFQKVYEEVLRNIKDVFPVVREFAVWVPSFGYAVNYIIGSKKYDPLTLSIDEVDNRLKDRNVKTRFYSGRAHLGMLLTPIIKMY